MICLTTVNVPDFSSNQIYNKMRDRYVHNKVSFCDKTASENIQKPTFFEKEHPLAYAQSSSEVIKNECSLTREEIELIALITMAEAEAEPVEGQRLVIDTILNRVDSPYFPDSVEEVIYQPYQFTCTHNGRLSRCYIRDDLVELVYEELENRYNNEVVFFRSGRYSDYGEPLFQVCCHYFSKY